LIEVLQQTSTSMLLLGEGLLRPRAQQRLDAAGLAARCQLPGFVTPVWGELRAAAAFVSLSKYEGRPNTVLEAMACECPLVVSDIPAHREFQDEERAILVQDILDPGSAAAAIADVLLRPEAARARALAARRSMREDWLPALSRPPMEASTKASFGRGGSGDTSRSPVHEPGARSRALAWSRATADRLDRGPRRYYRHPQGSRGPPRRPP
jgi:hypothetical protein